MSDAKFMVVKATKIKGHFPTTNGKLGTRVEVTPKAGRAVLCIVLDGLDQTAPFTHTDAEIELAKHGLLVESTLDRGVLPENTALTYWADEEPELTPPIASWQQDGDAREWARAFLQHQAQSADPAGFVEEGNLIGWFANAMMCAVDKVTRSKENGLG